MTEPTTADLERLAKAQVKMDEVEEALRAQQDVVDIYKAKLKSKVILSVGVWLLHTCRACSA